MSLVMLPMILTPAFNMVFTIMVAREVSLSVYGVFSYVMTLIYLVIGFSDLGLRDYFLSKKGKDKDYSSASTLASFTSVNFIILAIVLCSYLSEEENSSYKLIFISLLAEAFAMAVIHKSIYYVYQSANKLSNFSKIDAILRVLPITTKMVFFVVAGHLVEALLVGSMVALLIYSLWFLKIVNYKEIKNKARNIKYDFKILIRDWKEWSLFTLSFFSYFLYFGADKLVIKYIVGVDGLAIYAAAMSFMAIGQIVVGVLWSLYMPRLSRGEQLWGYKRFVLGLVAAGLLVACFFQVFSSIVFKCLYPESYDYAGYILSISSLYFLFRMPNVILEIYCVIDDEYERFVKLRLCLGVLSIILSVLIIPSVGVIGASYALVLSEMLLTISLLIGRKHLR
ncbi:oligosaccharide flippase family protein [Parahaliea sp. F7430]|uniref:Oligosaccharide flippase family protein n=1 Tax=Sediminihaliea albiluteola TaxID=2758564 RepID=A0A7W2TY45_9GAMM|nr:oligosaccharide flippase family protein [Sediminihaliea albiluteola]MBA6414060.1 oligosaccharide flippase family protein [Sediminihaliea albiluteola]